MIRLGNEYYYLGDIRMREFRLINEYKQSIYRDGFNTAERVKLIYKIIEEAYRIPMGKLKWAINTSSPYENKDEFGRTTVIQEQNVEYFDLYTYEALRIKGGEAGLYMYGDQFITNRYLAIRDIVDNYTPLDEAAEPYEFESDKERQAKMTAADMVYEERRGILQNYYMFIYGNPYGGPVISFRELDNLTIRDWLEFVTVAGLESDSQTVTYDADFIKENHGRVLSPDGDYSDFMDTLTAEDGEELTESGLESDKREEDVESE